MRNLRPKRYWRRIGWIVLTAAGTVIAFLAGYWAGYRWAPPPEAPPPVDYLDLLIIGGTVIDGTGRPGRRLDVGVRRGRIVWVGQWPRQGEKRVRVRRIVDATGRVVAPGFIDVHTHVEANIPREGPFRAPNFIGQGVTTIVTGNCGTSVVDVQSLFHRLEHQGSQVNIATLVGHNSLRREVLRSPDRPATPSEVAAMRARLRQAMEAGAVGFSTGLAYRPGVYATPQEVEELVRTVQSFGGLYATHIRDEGLGSREALREAIEVAQRTGVRLHVCHFKLAGRAQWGQAKERLHELEMLWGRVWKFLPDFRNLPSGILSGSCSQELRVTLDAYPYAASSTNLEVLVPPHLLQGDVFRRRPIEEVARAVVEQARRNQWSDFSFARVAYYAPDTSIEGLTIPEVAARWGETNPGDIEAQARVIVRMLRRGGAQMVYEEMDEKDVMQILAYPQTMYGSDSAVRTPGEGRPHPRGWGTFPRILGLYVRERRLLSLEEAIYRMTDLPARTFCLGRRGRIAPGYWADIVVLRPQTIRDRATYEDPFQRPMGIDFVWVNGDLVLDRGRETGRFPGQPVRRHCL